MASMRDIKRRRGSIQSTQQITKAMKLVSTVKLQRARAGAERAKPYFECMYNTVSNILLRMSAGENKYLAGDRPGKKAVIVITSNRGLAGGYNSNVVKLVTRNEEWDKDDLLIYAIGNKGKDLLQKSGYTIKESLPGLIEDPVYPDAMLLAQRLLEAFENEEVSEIYLAYTVFKNTVSQIPTVLRLLPVNLEDHKAEDLDENSAAMNFEPGDEEALDMIIPKYVASLIYGAIVEAMASENGARMQAMDNATSNAEDMISDLSLKYNRARQSSITQELTEIIAGAEAQV